MVGIVEILSLLSVISHKIVIYSSPLPPIIPIAAQNTTGIGLQTLNDTVDYNPLEINDQYNRLLNDMLNFLDDNEWQNYVQIMKNAIALNAAAKIGNLEMVKYLVEVKNESVESFHLDIAARYGNLDVIKYFFTIYPDASHVRTLVSAIKSQNLDLIRYLYEIMEPVLKFSESMLGHMFWFYVTLDDEPHLLRECLMDQNISAIIGDFLHIDERWRDNEKYKLFMDGDFLDDLESFSSEISGNESDESSESVEELDNHEQTHDIRDDQSEVSKSNVNELMGDEANILVRMLEDHQIISREKLTPELLKAYLYAAAKYGENQFFPYIVKKKNVKLDINLLNFAAANGQLLVVRYLIEKAGIEPNIDTLLFAYESLNRDLILYLFYNRKMIDNEEAAIMVDRKLAQFDSRVKFSDCISESHLMNAPLQSALKNVKKTDEIKKVHFNLGKNELYLVKRYLDKSQEIPKIQPNEENAFILLLKGIVGHQKQVLNQSRRVKQQRLH
jgi:hypothetical protein